MGVELAKVVVARTKSPLASSRYCGYLYSAAFLFFLL